MKKILVGALIVVVGLFLVSASSVLVQGEPCNADFDFDGDVDAINVNGFLEEFGRSQFNNPCPPDGPSRVAKTGQWRSDYFLDDGNKRWGVPWPNPRFTDNDNGTVTDNLTGLIWLKDAGGCHGIRDWDHAMAYTYLTHDGVCGLTDGSAEGDWRLPNARELMSLIHYNYFGPALPNRVGTGKWSEGNPFNNVQILGEYWTSTAYAENSNWAFYVWMQRGILGTRDKLQEHCVWPVKGGYDYQEGPI